MAGKLKGKTAIVTGGAGGIGRAICIALAEEGANVVVSDIGAARDGSGSATGPVDAVVAEVKKKGVDAIACFESVTDFEGAGRIIKACVDKWGKLDILVNCHGNVNAKMIWNMDKAIWDSVINIHLNGTFNTCQHACVVMKEQGFGRIINTTSDAWKGTGGQCNYGAAKGGIVSLTRSIAREMGKFGVTCNAYAPVAATRMTMDEDMKKNLIKRVQAGIITQKQYDDYLTSIPGPETVAPIILYLATDQAGFMNGQVFRVEGNRISIFSEPVEAKVIYKLGEKWSVQELIDIVPNTLAVGYVPPVPVPQKEKPAEKK